VEEIEAFWGEQPKYLCGGPEKWREKSEPGRFAEGPRQPRLILPASAVSEQETRKNSSTPCKKLAEAGRSKFLQKTRQKQTLQDPAKKTMQKSGGFFRRKI